VKIVSVFLAILLFSFNAFAAEKADKKLAIEYLKMARYEQMVTTTIDSYSQQLFKDMPSEDRAKFKKFLTDTMGWEATKDQLADLVVDLYTKQELNASMAFMKSKLGASMTAKNEKFSDMMAVQMSNNLQKFIQEHPLSPNPAVKPDAAR
jgi:hypothetical protein